MSPTELPSKPSRRARAVRTTGKGPTKGRRAPAPTRIQGKLRLKEAVEGGAVREAARGPQVDQMAPRAAAPDQPGYVRLTVHVGEDGSSSVIASHLVAGTLLVPTVIHGQFVYEVLHAGERLHVDSIPDLGVYRSF